MMPPPPDPPPPTRATVLSRTTGGATVLSHPPRYRRVAQPRAVCRSVIGALAGPVPASDVGPVHHHVAGAQPVLVRPLRVEQRREQRDARVVGDQQHRAGGRVDVAGPAPAGPPGAPRTRRPRSARPGAGPAGPPSGGEPVMPIATPCQVSRVRRAAEQMHHVGQQPVPGQPGAGRGRVGLTPCGSGAARTSGTASPGGSALACRSSTSVRVPGVGVRHVPSLPDWRSERLGKSMGAATSPMAAADGNAR